MTKEKSFWTERGLPIVIFIVVLNLIGFIWTSQETYREAAIERGDTEYRQRLDRRWDLADKCDLEMLEYGKWFEAQCPQLFSDGYLLVKPTALQLQKEPK